MSAPRNISEVIDRILAVVPESEAALRARLLSTKETAWFTAPEAMGRVWRLLSSVLTSELPADLPEPWQAQAGRIIRGEE
jgi:hypothetical protein